MSWKTFSIGDIAEVVTKGTTPTTYGMPFTDDGVNFIKAEALNGDVSLDRSGFTFISEDTHEKLKRSQLEPNDVLITIAGANVGKCGIVREEDLPANTNQAVGIIRVKPKLANPRFVYYHFKNPSVFSICQNFGGQAAQPNINLSILKNVKIKIPSLDFQKRIIGYISSYEDLIRNNRRRIQLLEESARLLYKEWFFHLRFPGHEHVKIVDGVPEGWAEKTLGEVIVLHYGKALKADDRVPGPYPVYGSSGVIGFHEKFLVKGPAIVLGRKGNVGSVFWCAKDFFPIDTVYFIESSSSSLYLYLALQKMKFINTDVAVPGLNRDMAYSRKILIPNPSLLTAFLREVEPMQQQIEKLAEYNNKLAEARDLLLPRLMNGELTL
jgi:type I restriction enzyme S subunit